MNKTTKLAWTAVVAAGAVAIGLVLLAQQEMSHVAEAFDSCSTTRHQDVISAEPGQAYLERLTTCMTGNGWAFQANRAREDLWFFHAPINPLNCQDRGKTDRDPSWPARCEGIKAQAHNRQIDSPDYWGSRWLVWLFD